MSTNIAQNTNIEKQGEKSSFFGFLKKNNTYPPSLHNNTNELLKAAYDMLASAEQDLIEKTKRIEALESIVTTDELTKMTNRRGFYQAFCGELERTNRDHNEGGVLIMIDLDDFKLINDIHGHQAGDEALKVVGEFLNNTIRTMDVAARVGGDEFIILFSNTCIAKSMERARKLGDDLNSLRFDWAGAEIKVKASLGLKEYKKGDTVESIIAAADKDMYTDKEKKKQRTTH